MSGEAQAPAADDLAGRTEESLRAGYPTLAERAVLERAVDELTERTIIMLRLGYSPSTALRTAMAVLARQCIVVRSEPLPLPLPRWVSPARSDDDAERLRELSRRLRTQNNCCTQDPVYLVHEQRRVYGLDPAYCDSVVWVDSDGDEATGEEYAQFEAHYDEHLKEPDGWYRTGYQDTWVVVQTFLTEQGAKDYIASNRHRHRGELQIYVESLHRNPEMQLVVRHLLSLTREGEEQSDGQSSTL